MNLILFDDQCCEQFLPFTYTRPLSEIRCGILTASERWKHLLSCTVSYNTRPHLQEKFKLLIKEDNLLINSRLLDSFKLLNEVKSLLPNEYLVYQNTILACRLSAEDSKNFSYERIPEQAKVYGGSINLLTNIWDIFFMNDTILRQDYEQLTQGRESQKPSTTNTILGNQLFIEEGARVECAILNTESGPIYIGKDAEVMEGSIVRGPFAMGEHAVLKMGAKIYGATTLGPLCKVGGEVNNSVFFANSNKAHDGFIGNAVIGEWCNIGADSNNSNLKNNYEEVKLWSESKKSFVKTGLQFCGLMMADHSKCGINTMFNTGTVVGVSCNIYGAGFPRNFIPSFSWGSANGFMEYQLNKAIETASKVFARRNMEFDEVEQNLLRHVFEQTQVQRNYSS